MLYNLDNTPYPSSVYCLGEEDKSAVLVHRTFDHRTDTTLFSHFCYIYSQFQGCQSPVQEKSRVKHRQREITCVKTLISKLFPKFNPPYPLFNSLCSFSFHNFCCIFQSSPPPFQVKTIFFLSFPKCSPSYKTVKSGCHCQTK